MKSLLLLAFWANCILALGRRGDLDLPLLARRSSDLETEKKDISKWNPTSLHDIRSGRYGFLTSQPEHILMKRQVGGKQPPWKQQQHPQAPRQESKLQAMFREADEKKKQKEQEKAERQARRTPKQAARAAERAARGSRASWMDPAQLEKVREKEKQYKRNTYGMTPEQKKDWKQQKRQERQDNKTKVKRKGSTPEPPSVSPGSDSASSPTHGATGPGPAKRPRRNPTTGPPGGPNAPTGLASLAAPFAMPPGGSPGGGSQPPQPMAANPHHGAQYPSGPMTSMMHSIVAGSQPHGSAYPSWAQLPPTAGAVQSHTGSPGSTWPGAVNPAVPPQQQQANWNSGASGFNSNTRPATPTPADFHAWSQGRYSILWPEAPASPLRPVAPGSPIPGSPVASPSPRPASPASRPTSPVSGAASLSREGSLGPFLETMGSSRPTGPYG